MKQKVKTKKEIKSKLIQLSSIYFKKHKHIDGVLPTGRTARKHWRAALTWSLGRTKNQVENKLIELCEKYCKSTEDETGPIGGTARKHWRAALRWSLGMDKRHGKVRRW